MSGDIPSYPRVTLPLDGSEMVLGFQNGRTVQMRVSEVSSSGLITAVEAVGLQTARRISLTGDVTQSLLFDGRADASGVATIAAKAVTNAKLADVGAFTLKGAMAAGSPVDLSMDQVTGMIQGPLFEKIASTNIVTATEDLAVGNFVNIYDNGGVSSVQKAFGADPSRFAIGFVRKNYTAGSSATVFYFGMNSVLLTGATDEVFLSDTVPGAYTTSPPTNPGSIVQPLGVGIPGVGIFFFPQQRISL